MTRREILRASVISAVLLPFLVYFALYAYIVVWTGMTVGQAMPRLSIWLLAMLSLGNFGLRGPLRRHRLTSSELRLIFTLTAIGLGTCGVGWAMSIVPTMGGSLIHYSSTSKAGWAQFIDQVPDWAMVTDPAVVKAFYSGYSTLYRWDHIRALIVPVMGWTSLLGLFIIAQLCLSEMLRVRWIRRERLSFPLVVLPMELADNPRKFWSNGIMWAGFLLVAIIIINNGINFLNPIVPEIKTKTNRLPKIETIPWTGLHPIELTFYPFMIGIAYILGTDVSLSIWLFYWLGKVQFVVAASMGLRSEGIWQAEAVPYLQWQGSGAFLMLGALALWRARHSIASAFNKATDREVPRWAVVGFVVATGTILWFGVSNGVPLTLMAMWVGMYTLFSVAIARLVGEAGTPQSAVPIFAQDLLHQRFADSYGGADWIHFTVFRNIDEISTDLPLVHSLSGFRVLEGRAESAKLTLLFFGMAMLGLLSGIWALCDIYFRHGVMNTQANWPVRGQATAPWGQIAAWLDNPVPQDGRWISTSVGMVVMMLLVLLRERVLWWSIHPLGFAIAGAPGVRTIWVPFFLGWLLKVITLRAGGLKLYRRLLPFALGIILADILIPQMWTIIGAILGEPMYFSFP